MKAVVIAVPSFWGGSDNTMSFNPVESRAWPCATDKVVVVAKDNPSPWIYLLPRFQTAVFGTDVGILKSS